LVVCTSGFAFFQVLLFSRSSVLGWACWFTHGTPRKICWLQDRDNSMCPVQWWQHTWQFPDITANLFVEMKKETF
jgi:hypothetical protein